MTPFVLRVRRLLPKEPEPSSEQFYDPVRQVWTDVLSGAISVEGMRHRSAASKFGETTFTEAREGADHAASPLLVASRFGETRITRGDEGVDEFAATDLLASQFGETTHTAAPEGIDDPRSAESFFSQFGETTMTKAPGEGADQTEIVPDELRAYLAP